MELIIHNKKITTPIIDILKQIRLECGNPYLKDMVDKHTDILVSCPFHKDGQEKNPSCSVLNRVDKSEVYGAFHCWSCGAKGTLPIFVARCFNESLAFGEEWLSERFGNILIDTIDISPPIAFNQGCSVHEQKIDLSMCELYHPYMDKRKLNLDTLKKYSVVYNKYHQTIVFPVWDYAGNYVMCTERSVNSKNFYIPADIQKPVYLLNFIRQDNINTVYVCESQINTLTLEGWGYRAVGLFGTGSEYQYDILKKSGIRTYILCLDGDTAGRNGVDKFIRAMPDDVLITVVILIEGKDVNDLTKEEFESLQKVDKSDWVKNRPKNKNKYLTYHG